MKTYPNSIQTQRGAALIVGLVLLLTLTLLAVSGMNTATLEVTMAGNSQYSEQAFQLAETGIDVSLQAGGFTPVAAINVAPFAPDPLYPDDIVQSSLTFVDCGDMPPRRGFATSLGSSFQAYYFITVATGNSSRNATSTNAQNFFVIGPASACN